MLSSILGLLVLHKIVCIVIHHELCVVLIGLWGKMGCSMHALAVVWLLLLRAAWSDIHLLKISTQFLRILVQLLSDGFETLQLSLLMLYWVSRGLLLHAMILLLRVRCTDRAYLLLMHTPYGTILTLRRHRLLIVYDLLDSSICLHHLFNFICLHSEDWHASSIRASSLVVVFESFVGQILLVH